MSRRRKLGWSLRAIVRENPNHRFEIYCRGADQKYHRHVFKNKQQAAAELYKRNFDFREYGSTALKLSQYEYAAFQKCRDELAVVGLTIEDAKKYAIEREQARLKSSAIDRVCAEFVETRRKYSRPEFNAIRRLAERLCEVFGGGRLICDIHTRDLEEFLNKIGPNWSNRSRNQWRSRLCRLWKYADKQGYSAEKVARNIDWRTPADTTIGVVTPAEAARLLAIGPPKIVAGVPIGLFAGLRNSEICRLDWGDVILRDKPDSEGCYGIIRVLGRNAKTAEHRHVDIVANLAAWLRPLKKTSGPVVAPNSTAYFDELLKPAAQKAGIADWPNNALRHSFGSYHYAHSRSLKDAMFQMGHTSPYTFLKHYRGLVTAEEAAEYWQITPGSRPETANVFAFTPEAYPWRRRFGRVVDGDWIDGVKNLAHYFGCDYRLPYWWFNHVRDCPPRPEDDRFHIPTWRAFVARHPEWKSAKYECSKLYYVSWYCDSGNEMRKYFVTEDEAEAYANERNRELLAKELLLEEIQNVIEFNPRKSLSAYTVQLPIPPRTSENAGSAG